MLLTTKSTTTTTTFVVMLPLFLLPLLLSVCCILTKVPFCESFSASSVNLGNRHQNIFIQQQQQQERLETVDKDNNDNNNNTITTKSHNHWFVFPLRRRQVLEFPSLQMEFPAQGIQDSHEAYLRRHQIVKKRRVVKRMWEIATILSGQVLRPFLCSMIKIKPNLQQLHIPTDADWDDFWNYPQKGNNNNNKSNNKSKNNKQQLTNAERVARGVPALGPTFVKLAQILATRPDILHVPLAQALGELQDNVPPFDDLTAKRMIRNDIQLALQSADYSSKYIQNKQDLQTFMDSLSAKPKAAASVAQVYQGHLPGYGKVAVKVMRPGIRAKVERDATLFHSIATWVESWNNNTLQLPFVGRKLQETSPLGSLQLVQAVDEFTSRVLEDMDFTREAENMQVFAQLYDTRRGTSPTVQVVVPEVIPELCSSRVLVMEWLQGQKLTTICDDCYERPQQVQENLQLIVQAIECTISQLIDHGLLHGDPHSANLLKVYNKQGKAQLGYLDFGLVSYVPQRFRDGIVIAVVQLVFARNIQAVADLCGDLGLLPEETLQDAGERKRFLDALQKVLDDVLIWPKNQEGLSTDVPKVRFENLLPAVSQLIRSFEFTVPPYFLNNIRALATLEGMALNLDPNFNVLRVIYPYSINRLMRNPSVSKRVQETFVDICKSPDTQLISPKRVRMLLNDWALWTGYRKRKVFWDLLTCAGGRRVAPAILYNWYLNRLRNIRTLVRGCGRVVQSGYQKVWNTLTLQRLRQPQTA